MAAEAEDYVKYQYIIMGQQSDDGSTSFRAGYVPVEERDGKRVACGQLIDITHIADEGQLMSYAGEFLDNDDPGCSLSLERAVGIEVPPGWTLMGDFPLPDDYVPESAEVFEEGERRDFEEMREFLRQKGVWRD